MSRIEKIREITINNCPRDPFSRNTISDLQKICAAMFEIARITDDEEIEDTAAATKHNPSYLLEISDGTEPLVTIKPNGTVVIHKEGSAPQAAKLFYEALQIEGKTLFGRIDELKKEVEQLKEGL